MVGAYICTLYFSLLDVFLRTLHSSINICLGLAHTRLAEFGCQKWLAVDLFLGPVLGLFVCAWFWGSHVRHKCHQPRTHMATSAPVLFDSDVAPPDSYHQQQIIRQHLRTLGETLLSLGAALDVTDNTSTSGTATSKYRSAHVRVHACVGVLFFV